MIGYDRGGDGLYLDHWPGEWRVAVMQGGRLADCYLERAAHPVFHGALCAGSVRKVHPPMQAAFVDVGMGCDGLLPLGQVEDSDLTAQGTLAEGQLIACRIQREAFEDKGPRLSARLSTTDRQAVADWRRDLGKSGGKSVGVVARPDPLDHWLAPWRDSGLPLYFTQSTVLARLRCVGLGTLVPVSAVQEVALFERAGVEAELDALLLPDVALPSGGALLIEQTRTLCAIDVNTGHATKYKTLIRDAVAELMRQLRLRHIGGRIVVDLPLLNNTDDLVNDLRRLCRADPVAMRFQPPSVSGLLELTRHRRGHSWRDLMCVPTGVDGMGAALSLDTQSYQACRAVLRGGIAAWQDTPDHIKDAIRGTELGQALHQRTGIILK